MFGELKSKPAPRWDLWAVLIGSIVSSLTTFLPLYMLGRVPFSPSNLSILPTDQYYRAQIFFFPVFALAVWLLMSGVAHIILRLSNKEGNFDHIGNSVHSRQVIDPPSVLSMVRIWTKGTQPQG
jgi:uncharacterized membrane protein HdeD (DUF308 family)